MTGLVYGGVEGGGTHSTTMIFNDKGEKLAEVEGPSTNLYQVCSAEVWLNTKIFVLQIGMDETNKRIHDMVKQCLELAGLATDTTLEV